MEFKVGDIVRIKPFNEIEGINLEWYKNAKKAIPKTTKITKSKYNKAWKEWEYVVAKAPGTWTDLFLMKEVDNQLTFDF